MSATAPQPAYQFTPDMEEISGLGGDYEAMCRQMLAAGCRWLDEHRSDDLDDPAVDEAFDAAIEEPALAGGGSSGAMHMVAKNRALWIKANGWDAFVREMTNPGGRIAILERELARAKEEEDRWRKAYDRLWEKNRKMTDIIATRVLCWQKYGTHSDESEQRAYGPSKEAVQTKIRAGNWLTKLVDDEIDRMTVE